MMKKINNEKNEKKRRKKYKSYVSRYVLLCQVGFLGERKIELSEDDTSTDQLLKCEDKERVLGDGSETIIPFEENGKPRYLPACENYHDFCIPNPGIPRPYDVPSDFFANVIAPGRTLEKKGRCYAVLSITDPNADADKLSVTLIIKADKAEHLPIAKAGDIIRMHRALLVQHEGKNVVIFAALPVASWVLCSVAGGEMQCTGKYAWDLLDEQMLECYKLFGKTVCRDTEYHNDIPEGYEKIASDLYAPTGKLYQWNLPNELATDIDRTSDLDTLANQY